jgi:hypothetical protein
MTALAGYMPFLFMYFTFCELVALLSLPNYLSSCTCAAGLLQKCCHLDVVLGCSWSVTPTFHVAHLLF